MAHTLHDGFPAAVINVTLRYALIVVAAVALCAVALSFWLLRTDAGASWLWARALAASPDRLEAATFHGNLRSGVEISGLRYADDGVEIRAKSLSFSLDAELFSPGVRVRELRLSDVTVQQRDTAGGASDAAAPAIEDVLPTLRLPIAVRVDDLLAERLSLAAADGTTMLAVETVGFDARWHDDLTIERLRYAAGNISATGTLRFGLAAPHDVTLVSRIRATGGASSWTPGEISASFEGDLQALAVTVASSSPQLTISGTIESLLDRPDLDIRLTARRLALPLDEEKPPVELADLVLLVNGGVHDYAAQLDTQLLPEYAAPLAVTATLRGDLRSLQVESLALASDDLAASGSGSMSWHDGFAARALLEVRQLIPRRWLREWPATQFIEGQTALAYREGRLEIERLTAQLGNSEATLTAAGVVDTRDGRVDARVTWQDLQWPLQPAAAAIDSRAASLHLQGTLDSWNLDGDVTLGGQELPQGRFLLQGNGSRSSANLQIKDSEVLGGRINGRLTIATDNGGEWSAQLQTLDTSIAPLAPSWPGRISANLDASGVVAPFAVNVAIRDLTGNLRDREISAQGALRLAGRQLRFEQLRIRSGSSTLELDGDWQDADGVVFRFNSPAISDVLPGAAGSVEAEGRLSAGRDWPQLSLNLSGSELAWQGWYVAELSARNEPGPAAEPFGLQLDATGIAADTTPVSAASVSLQGMPERHTLALALQNEAERLRAELQGGARDWQPIDSLVWQGEIDDLRYQGRNDLELTLREQVPLRLGRDGASFEQACIDINHGGSFCAAGRIAQRQYRAQLDLAEVPLNLLRTFSATSLQFDQLLSGSMELATGPGGRPSGLGRIDVTPGTIVNPIDERLTLRTRAGFASFELQEGQLLAGEINLPFSSAAQIAGTFRVLDIAQGRQSAIAGQLAITVKDLGASARIVPQIDDAGGSLDADIRIDGTLDAPVLAGGFTVSDGRLAYAPLGLRLSDIELRSNVLPGNRVELTSTFKAGEGSGRLSSTADYLQGRSGGFEVSLVGENLTLIALPDLSVQVNPDLQLGIRGDDIRINGKIAVPSARVSSVALVNTGASESEDVSFVGPVQPAQVAKGEASSPLNYSGSVVLELGENVVVDLELAEARLFGSATYRWDGEALPTASGNFGIAGKFEAYGQLLEITEGTIRYVDAPANNPQLRIRAEREIFGNSQVRRAGVLVGGTALRPNLEVYTTPATTPNRALTLLVTGSDFNYEQGVGAVDVGTYIAPRLYASYGIGLFDRENVISVRYDLSKGFGIKATSGKEAAGIDISYTIER